MSSERTPSPADELVARVVRPDILEMSSYHVPPSAGVVKLDAMENPYRLPEAMRAELAKRLADVALNRYPVPTYSRLRSMIRARLGVPEGFDVILGNGSDELIAMLSVATATPQATVLAPWPSFVMYDMSTRLAGSRFVGVPLAPGFGLDLPAMLAAIERHRPAIVYLAYPNNPTGNCFDDAAIESILAAAPGAVVVDEAYQPFAQVSWMSRLPRHPNLLVMRTVSKLGLAGLRLGYLSAAQPWLDQLEKVRPPYNVNVLTEAAAEFALEHVEVLDAQAARIREDRQALAAALARLPGVEAFPSQANFLLLRVADGPSTWRALRERGVLVKDVGRMHPSLANCLRLTVGAPDENDALLAALGRSLAVLA
jgi:histidinol-phosphate aminotransferase